MMNPEHDIMALIELEQTIMSGVDDKGQVQSDNFMAKKLLEKIKAVGRPIDRLRVLCIYVLCYGLPDSDFGTLMK